MLPDTSPHLHNLLGTVLSGSPEMLSPGLEVPKNTPPSKHNSQLVGSAYFFQSTPGKLQVSVSNPLTLGERVSHQVFTLESSKSQQWGEPGGAEGLADQELPSSLVHFGGPYVTLS